MSKAPKQRKAQLHYQPYQQSGGGSNVGEGSGAPGFLATAGGTGGSSNGATSSSVDYGLTDIMDPVLTGYSSNLSRNLWDDWNENDPMKFDMFTDDNLGGNNTGSSHTTPLGSVTGGNGNSTGVGSNSAGFMSSVIHSNNTPQQQPPAVQSSESMDVDGPRLPLLNGFQSLSSQPRLSVKRSFSEDLVSMLDEDDGNDHDPFVATNGNLNKQLSSSGFSFNQHSSHNASNHASPVGQKPQQQQQLPPRLQQPHASPSVPQGQQLLVQHATDWLNGFPATGMPTGHQQQHQQSPKPPAQQQQPPQQSALQLPLSPASAARLEAHNERPDPTPMERATAAIASTLVAVPNPCKESNPPPASTETTPAIAVNSITPSPFSAYSFMSAAIESSKSGEGTSEGGGDKIGNPFTGNAAGMMMPGFMMYSMPMMGNYQAAAAAAAAMGMMPMGAMQMGPMGMPMGGMQMNPIGMQMGLPLGAMGGMQMGMPMMQMAASMGVPVPGLSGGAQLPSDTSGNDVTMKIGQKALQPKGSSLLAPATGGSVGANGSFVSIARKPEEPEVSNILKSLMEEEAKKKEKKLERNRDSARESRKKQQTYVETLENGIKRLQINRDLVVSYRWGVTGGPYSANLFEWTERVAVVTGQSESFSTLQNPANFQNLMRINRQRRTLSLSRSEKERAIMKCFVCVGRQLAGLRTRLLELQVFRAIANPASTVGQELGQLLNLTEEQRLKLECHSNRVFAEEVVAMVKLFKVFFVLRDQAIRLNLLSPELERYMRDVCSMEQLQKLLQWTELHRTTIESNSGGFSLLS